MTIGIYSITHVESGKRYIGKSINIEARWCRHRSAKTNRHLVSAFEKYGIQSFSFEVIQAFESVDENAIADAELYWIDHFNTCNRDFGYNLRRDSSSLSETHQETRAKMREAWKTRPPISDATRLKYSKASKAGWSTEAGRAKRLNALQSPETRAKMSIAKKNMSDESKAKISIHSKNRRASEQTKAKLSKAMTGRSVSKETRRKISEASMGHAVSEITRQKISVAASNISSETRLKMSVSGHKRFTKHKSEHGIGRIVSDSTKAKMSVAAKNRSPEHKAKLLIANKNKSPETLLKLSNAAKLQHQRRREKANESAF